MNQQQLIERIRNKDADALAALIDAKRRPLLVFIERQLGAALRTKLEPEDILQDTCSDAVRSLPDVDLQDRDPFNWLCQIAERRIIDAHRRFFDAQKRDAGRERPLSSPGNDGKSGGFIDLLVASLTTPSQAFSRNAKEARLIAELNKLPAEQRDAVRMKYLENLPSKEIAERLGKSDAAVRVMLSRAVKKLHGMLQDIAPEAS